MALVISTKITTGVVLNNSTTQNPATITATGYVSNTTYAIYGQSGFAWTVDNLGTVNSQGTSGIGILLGSGGSVTNGSSTSTAALIEGYSGVEIVQIVGTGGTVTNFGTIEGIGSLSEGIVLWADGSVTNGSSSSTKALIEGGHFGVLSFGSAGTVANFGTIEGGLSTGAGVANGSSGSTAALIEGSVSTSGSASTVANFGTIEGSTYLSAGGRVTNGSSSSTKALIEGYFGVKIVGAAGAVTNFGTIDGTGSHSGGVRLVVGGSVANGSSSATKALIEGSYGVEAGTVTNFGTIEGTASGGYPSGGILLEAGGSVANGSSGSTAALIEGSVSGFAGTVTNFGTMEGGIGLDAGTVTNFGTVEGSIGLGAGTVTNFGTVEGSISLGAGTVTNFSTIESTGTAATAGVYLGTGGSVTNGSSSSTKALIESGNTGVSIAGSAGTAINFGTIEGTASYSDGVYLKAGGRVTNGSSGSTTALIVGADHGVSIAGSAGTVNNFGTIQCIGTASASVYLKAGGSVTNGWSGSTTALIEGGVWVWFGGAGTVTNFGTIEGTASAGVYLEVGGRVTNGSSGSTTALILGGNRGVSIAGSAGTVANFGTIQCTGTASDGVYLKAGGSVTNGSSGSTAALIEGGWVGVGAGTVTNFGTIEGTAIYSAGVRVGGAVGIVTNLGTIQCTGTGSTGVFFLDTGGRVTNGLNRSTKALITGGYAGVEFYGSAGTVTNFGTIESTGTAAKAGVYLGTGGTVTNESGGTIGGSGSGGSIYISGGSSTVINAGTLVGGVWLQTAGTVTNTVGGTISGYTDTGGYGVGLYAGGSVINAGRIRGQGVGVEIGGFTETLGGGSLINQAGGTISGYDGVAGGHAATVTNTGSIAGTKAITFDGFVLGDGVYMNAGGVVTNRTGGAITGVGVGVLFTGTFANTLTNAGTIVGVGGTAVQFGGGNDLLIVDAGAVFSGAVNGGGGTNKVEFAAAGTDNVTGFSGFETIVLANGGANSLTLKNANFAGVTGASITVIGGNAGNTVNAGALTGLNRVIVVGGAGIDTLTGGAGNDVFEFSAANLTATDTVNGGAGSNELLMTTAGTVAASGVIGVETYHLANGAPNSLTLANANFLGGVTGATITVDDGNAGNTVNASALTGTNRVFVHAGSAADTLTGGAGNDFFYAGGDTSMTGGAGTNFFVFLAPGTSNTVTDFATGSTTNRLVFSNAAFNLGQSAPSANPQLLVNASTLFVANGTGTFANTSQRLAYDTSNGELFSSTDGSGGASRLVATLTGDPAVSATHLFFVS